MTTEQTAYQGNSGSLDDQLTTQLDVDTRIRAYLTETCKWSKFLAIVGFVMIGIIVLVGLAFGTIMDTMSGASGLPGTFKWFGIVYVLFFVIAAIGGLASLTS